MAYSSGFSPHPRISYANASPTGAASEAEYLEIGLAQACDPSKVRDALDAALPPGLDVLEVITAPTGALADLLSGSSWLIDVVGVSREVATSAIEAFLREASIIVERMTKNGMRSFDTRQAVIALSLDDRRPAGASPETDLCEDDRERTRLHLVSQHFEPLVRPDDVLKALAKVEPAFTPSEVPILTRLAQGLLDPDTGSIADPFG